MTRKDRKMLDQYMMLRRLFQVKSKVFESAQRAERYEREYAEATAYFSSKPGLLKECLDSVQFKWIKRNEASKRWVFYMTKSKQKYYKRFNDADYGSTELAKAAAKRYSRNMVSKLKVKKGEEFE